MVLALFLTSCSSEEPHADTGDASRTDAADTSAVDPCEGVGSTVTASTGGHSIDHYSSREVTMQIECCPVIETARITLETSFYKENVSLRMGAPNGSNYLLFSDYNASSFEETFYSPPELKGLPGSSGNGAWRLSMSVNGYGPLRVDLWEVVLECGTG